MLVSAQCIHSAVQCSAVQCSAVQCSAVQCSAGARCQRIFTERADTDCVLTQDCIHSSHMNTLCTPYTVHIYTALHYAHAVPLIPCRLRYHVLLLSAVTPSSTRLGTPESWQAPCTPERSCSSSAKAVRAACKTTFAPAGAVLFQVWERVTD